MSTVAIRLVIVSEQRLLTEAIATALGTDPDVEVLTCAPHDGVPNGDVVLVDADLPDSAGLAGRIRTTSPRTPILMLARRIERHLALRAVRAGCSGFVTTDRPLDELLTTARAARTGGLAPSASLLARVAEGLADERRPMPPTTLTPRELEVLELVCEGLPNVEIARRLGVSHNTVRSHVHRVLAKLGAHSKLEAAVAAERLGLVARPA